MPIPLEKLREVQTIVVHGNCSDGLASAIILDDILPGREIIHFAHHSTTPLESKPGMLFCDISPPRARVEEFKAVGAIVLDHHRSAREVTEAFEHHVFGDEWKDRGVSGAVLAHREVWKVLHPHWLGQQDFDPQGVEHFAKVIGIRDTWQTKDPLFGQGCVFAEMLSFFPRKYWLGTPSPQMLRIHNRETLASRMRVGEVAMENKMEGSKHLAEHGLYFRSRSKGTHCVILPGRRINDAADMVRPDSELILGFSYLAEKDEVKLLISARTRHGYNCAQFCAFYGGGGHTEAAGCDVPVPDRGLNPYDMIRDMVETYEAR